MADLKVETVVYYDPAFPSAWINKNKRYPEKIANAFSFKGIKMLDASSLKAFILEALNNCTAHQKLIVFSQDVAPDTIVESNSSDNTLRQYLDAGGSVLWIGDIPLYYKGEADKEEPTLIADSGAPTEILGIIPVFSVPKTSVSFTHHGRLVGLRTKWSGMRPVIQDKEIKALAKSESVLCRYYIDIEKRKNIFSRLRDKLGTIQSFKAMDFEVSFGKEPRSTPRKTPVYIHETHVNAWVKCFNSYFSNSGFYRIWDYPPMNMREKMIEELIDVSQRISRRIARTSQTFWMPR